MFHKSMVDLFQFFKTNFYYFSREYNKILL